MSKAHVIVYSRPGCHLCDEAKEAIKLAGCDEAFELEEINIQTSRQLLLLYQFDIPVIMIDGEEAFRHRVDTEKFRQLMLPHGDQ
ncbi:MAG TPA: glutaredoxin family protein [Pyrinomonadaceae bacterium]|nr:glutaredoxin family protein [Pyrinomonadaceae bacterium]